MTTPATTQHWLDEEHPEYARLKARWEYTRDHYTGELLDAAKLGTYLIQKGVGESDQAYLERKRLADYTNIFAALVDSLSGMLWGSDDKTTRVWNGAGGGFDFGAVEDQRTLIGRLFRDADGHGLPYLTLWKGATVDLLLDQRVWVVADTQGIDTTGTKRTVLRILPALSVPNWAADEQGLTEVVVKEDREGGATVKTRAKKMERRVLYTRAGWERWQKIDGGAWMLDTVGAYRYENPLGGPALPIFRVDLPLSRQVGWLLAKKANAIFNRESSRDNIINLANHPRLNVVADDTGFDKVVDQLVKGANALQVKPGAEAHGYIAPDSGPAQIATEVLTQKVEQYFVTALREYGDAARQRTATEVRQEVAQGVGAFLALVGSAMDQAENGALWRLAQTEKPSTAASAVQARVQRSDDFATVDPDAVIDKLLGRVFGKDVPVPIGNEGRVQAALQFAAFQGLEVDEDEVRQNVALLGAMEILKAYAGLPLVAPVRVQLLNLLLESTDLLRGLESTAMADGTRVDAIKAILEAALAMAEAEDEQARRGGEFLGAPGPMMPVDESTPGMPPTPLATGARMSRGPGTPPSMYRVGDGVQVADGMEHDAMTRKKAGVVRVVGTPALGIEFDGMAGVHKWYVDEEVEPAAARSDPSPATRAAPRPMDM